MKKEVNTEVGDVMVKNGVSKELINKIYVKKYKSFRGVDFSRDASMVDDQHSPEAINLISDISGFPEKRVGWRNVISFDGRINGIFAFDSDEGKCTIVHSGKKFYKLSENGETELLFENAADEKSVAKYFKGKLCILTGSEYLIFDGEKCIGAGEVEERYVPITLMSRETMRIGSLQLSSDTTFKEWDTNGTFENSDGSSVAYGTAPENVAINLISPRRKNHFELAKSGIVVFALDSEIDRNSRVIMRYIPTGEILFDVTFAGEQGVQRYNYTDEGVNREILNEYTYSSSHTPVQVCIGNSERNNCGFVACSPKTTAITGYYHIAGVDDFSIEYSHTTEGHSSRINKCTVMDVFENRIFFSGNPDYPNADWYSGVNDPLYIPDTNYTEIGVDSCGIRGYLRTGSEQAILKGDGEDATVYMRSGSAESDGEIIFPIRQGTSGIGAVGRFAICTFLDDPLYLTRNGVYAIALQDISRERALSLRSTRINKRLLTHADLSSAVMCEWNGYMLLCVDDVAYVADAGQKQYVGNDTGSYEYEWYYWTNIPARVMAEIRGELFFGTEDGRVCKFSTDMKDSKGEIPDEAYSDDGKAIVAQWATNLSDDGDFMQEKTLVKKGSGVLLKDNKLSDVSIIVRTETGFEREVASKEDGMYNSKNASYIMVPLNSKVKNYGAIQIICKNDKPNQAFGIGGIVRRYFKGKVKK
ncbi:MAG: hypothetical protein IJO61_04905 [Oscillospiraceae bacterium]|nr:hypothetical protein [Oscillospiraceae bacterium]